MDKFDRIQQLHRIFKNRRLPVPVRLLAEELECTERNVKRLLETMQLVDAPLVYDESGRGWRYEKNEGDLFELAVIEKEVTKLLKARGIDPSAFADQLRILPMAQRQLQGKVFHRVTEALLLKKQLHIYYSDYQGINSDRYISPQHLVYYRENWYLDAFCHLRNSLRTFSVARIIRADILKSDRKQMDREILQNHFSTSYGIFAGKPRHQARLRFFPAVARDIASQQWHPDQLGEWDGRDYLLTLPYANDKELIQDILRHLPHVRVESPTELRQAVQHRLRLALAMYEKIESE